MFLKTFEISMSVCLFGFVLIVLYATADSLGLDNWGHGTDVSVRIRLLSEWS